MTASELAARLDAKPHGNGWMAKCPAHQDDRASLSIDNGDKGGVVFNCFAGCEQIAILSALGLSWADLMGTNGARATKPESKPAKKRRIVKTYGYPDLQGVLRHETVRYEPKGFSQRRPDGTGGWIWNLDNVALVLYRLPELKGQRVVAIVEGEKDADRLWSIGVPATTNAGGASKNPDKPKWRADYTQQLVAAGVELVVIFPHNDEPGRAHAEAIARSCRAAGLKVKIVTLPDLPAKGDVSDYLDGHTKADLKALVKAAPFYEPATLDVPAAVAPRASPTVPRTLAEVCEVFTRWLGEKYDLWALYAVLAAAAAERLRGDPLWLLVVSGSGNAKTETVQALEGAGALVTSTISSEGALLSGSARRECSKDATGGLLRRLGSRGLLVVKDVTSILAMNRDTRASLLAALREIHDGKWERNVGTDGGRSLAWTGRIVIIGAVTTAWDRAHDVIASMGDRFVVVRMDSTVGRMVAGRHACRNTGDEERMRAELASVVGGVLSTVDARTAITLTQDEQERLLQAADVVTLARTGVDYDYRGDVIDAHAPEMPTRFAKQLTQMVRGAVAIGVPRSAALGLAIRCARDSMPPLRLAILDDLAMHPGSLTRDVRRRLEKPRSTVDRQLQSLHMLGVLTCDEEEDSHHGQPVTRWRYRLVSGINPNVLEMDSDSVPEIPPHTGTGKKEEKQSVSIPTDFSGTENGGRAQ